MAFISIQNDGPLITSTDYWESEWAKQGIVACSMNARAFRILLPDWIRDYGSVEEAIAEIKTGRTVTVEKRRQGGVMSFDFVFEDGSDAPYSITLGANQLLNLVPADTEHGKKVRVVVYTRGLKKAYEADGVFKVIK